MYGRAPRLPVYTLCPPGDDEHFESVNDYVDKLRGGLHAAFRATALALQSAASNQKALYDRKARHVDFQIGDAVFIQRVDPVEGLTPKLQPKWMGPYIICLVMGDEVLVQPEGKRGNTKWVHKNQCKPFKVRCPASNEGNDALASAEPSSTDGDNGSPDDSQLTVSGESDRVADVVRPAEGEEPRDMANEGYNLRPRVPVYYGN